MFSSTISGFCQIVNSYTPEVLKKVGRGALKALPYTLPVLGSKLFADSLLEKSSVAQLIDRIYAESSLSYKIKYNVFHLFLSAVAAPIVEEFCFREILQTQVFKRLQEKIEQICPSHLISSKWTRNILTSALFAFTHRINRLVQTEEENRLHLLTCFAFGLLCGNLRESDLGLAGAIGAHAANNFLSYFI
jgi:membrane protease YdiL (CAAX protease family)